MYSVQVYLNVFSFLWRMYFTFNLSWFGFGHQLVPGVIISNMNMNFEEGFWRALSSLRLLTKTTLSNENVIMSSSSSPSTRFIFLYKPRAHDLIYWAQGSVGRNYAKVISFGHKKEQTENHKFFRWASKNIPSTQCSRLKLQYWHYWH